MIGFPGIFCGRNFAEVLLNTKSLFVRDTHPLLFMGSWKQVLKEESLHSWPALSEQMLGQKSVPGSKCCVTIVVSLVINTGVAEELHTRISSQN